MIAGIDVSTRVIALVVIHSKDGRLIRTDEFEIPELARLPNKAERCRAIAETGFAAALKRVKVAYVEQPMGRQVKGVAEVERVVGATIANVPAHCSVSLITPAEWKKRVGLNGNAGKDLIAAHALGIYPVLEGASQDVLDAAMIARACWEEGAIQCRP